MALPVIALFVLPGAALAVEAQPIGKIARVGVLASSSETNFGSSVKVFRKALRA